MITPNNSINSVNDTNCCAICLEESKFKMKCCNQYIHPLCLEKWCKLNIENLWCPICTTHLKYSLDPILLTIYYKYFNSKDHNKILYIPPQQQQQQEVNCCCFNFFNLFNF